MSSFPTRRGVTIGISALIGAGAVRANAMATNPIAAIEKRHGGRLGVCVLDTGSGRTMLHRADERFLLCSTFKGVLAAMVLSRVDAGSGRCKPRPLPTSQCDDLANLVPYSAKDLLPSSPVTTAHVKQGALPVGTLCAAILETSDNAGANLLLARVGGPASLTAYVRGLGDTVTRFDRYELAAGERVGDLDTTTPRAIVATARTIVLGNVLSPGSRMLLERWMVASTVGLHRLRASFPPSWITADRTGTGDGMCNNYAVTRRPGAAPLVMAAYYDAPGMDTAAQEAVLREVGSAIVTWSTSSKAGGLGGWLIPRAGSGAAHRLTRP